MDNVTQQNAALVEEAAAAAESLQEQASQLSELVAVFTLHKASTSAALSLAAREVAPAALARPAQKAKAAERPALPHAVPRQPIVAPRASASARPRAKAAVANGPAGEWVEF
jgi:hypothetical protein